MTTIDFRKKDLVVFDLDGTLAPTKAVMDAEMSRLVAELLEHTQVAVIGGGKYALFKTQFLAALACPKSLLRRLFLFPTTSTAFYRYHHGWKNVYRLLLSKQERTRIKKAFREVFREAHYVHPEKIYGKLIEDRGTQVTFSALGQEVVSVLGRTKGVRLKEEWRKKNTPIKLAMAKMLQKRLSDLEVRAAGHTSIDVTRKGIDKAYGLRQIKDHLHIPISRMLFIGDALFKGGNDYAARRTGVQCLAVKGPEDTKRIIRKIIGATR